MPFHIDLFCFPMYFDQNSILSSNYNLTILVTVEPQCNRNNFKRIFHSFIELNWICHSLFLFNWWDELFYLHSSIIFIWNDNIVSMLSLSLTLSNHLALIFLSCGRLAGHTMFACFLVYVKISLVVIHSGVQKWFIPYIKIHFFVLFFVLCALSRVIIIIIIAFMNDT